MDFKQIQCFITVAETQSFTETATKLFISQPAVSRQIANMEFELGVTLFSRKNRLIVLTPAGQIMFNAFQEMLDIYNKSHIQAVRASEQEDILRLGIAHFIPLAPLPSAVRNFINNSQKNVFVEYATFPEIINSLNNGNYDAVITIDKTVRNNPAIEYKSLIKTSVTFVYSSKLIEGKESLGLSALNGLDFFIPEESFIPEGKESVISTCEKLGITPGNINYVHDTNTMVFKAETSQGVILLDEYAQKTLRYQDVNLVAIPVPLWHEFVLAYKKGSQHSMLNSFLDAIEAS